MRLILSVKIIGLLHQILEPKIKQVYIYKFLTKSTEFDKNFSKWSHYSTDHKN